MAYIEQEPIIDFIQKGLNNPDKEKAYGYDAIEILAEIAFAPTLDAEKVVVCKKCKHRGTLNCPMYNEERVYWDDDGYTEVDVIVTDHTVDDGYCNFGEE